MDNFREVHIFPVVTLLKNTYLLDAKKGDVNGDSFIDHIFLYGNKPHGPHGSITNNITLIIQEGYTNNIEIINLLPSSYSNPKLDLKDFSGDGIYDIKVSISSQDKLGYTFYCIYSYRNNILKKLYEFKE